MDFLNVDGKPVEKLTNPSQTPKFAANEQISAIRVTLNHAVDDKTIVAGGFNADPATFSFLVRADWSTLTNKYLPGSASPENAQTTRFTVDPQFRILRAGTYLVTLFGNKDAAGKRPAIADTKGLRLDGEPTQLPSGNGIEGGDFVFQFVIS